VRVLVCIGVSALVFVYAVCNAMMYSVGVNVPVCVLDIFNKLERDIYSVGVNALVFVLGI